MTKTAALPPLFLRLPPRPSWRTRSTIARPARPTASSTAARPAPSPGPRALSFAPSSARSLARSCPPKSDGYLSEKDKRELTKMQNKASKHIASEGNTIGLEARRRGEAASPSYRLPLMPPWIAISRHLLT